MKKRGIVLLVLGFLVAGTIYKTVWGGDSFPAGTIVSLRTLRNAVSNYYGSTEGIFPKNLSQLVPNYIASIPACTTPWHGTQTGVQIYTSGVTTMGIVDPKKIMDTGKWGYVNAPSSIDNGMVFIDCRHSDSSPDVTSGVIQNLQTIRSAVSIYYNDTEGVFPSSLSALVPKYLPSLPRCVTSSHGVQTGETIYSQKPLTASQVKDTGKWGYIPTTGDVIISALDYNLWLK